MFNGIKKCFFCHFENEMTSVMRIMDNDGKTKKIMQYSPFGEVYEFGKTKDIERMPLSFTSYESEENLNLMYAQARYYLPKVGRFAEEDSNKGNGYLPESLNYYAYCYNNPVNFIDLDGNDPLSILYPNEINSKKRIPLKDVMSKYMGNIKSSTWNNVKKSLTVVLVQNNIERKLIFRKDLKYVYEIRNTGDDIIYNLDYYIYIDKNNNMILLGGDLYYIFSCTEKKLYDRSTPIHVEYKVNNPNNVKPNEEGDVTKLYFKQKGEAIIYADNPEGIGKHIFDDEKLKSMYYCLYNGVKTLAFRRNL